MELQARANAAAQLSGSGLDRIIRPEAALNWLSPTLKQMTPARIEAILRGALGGDFCSQWELFDLMEDTWPRLMKNLNEVKRAVQKLNWKIEAWAEEDQAPSESAQEKAKFVSQAFWKMRPDPATGDNGFKATIYDILDAWGKGTSVLEIIWDAEAAGDAGIVPQGTASVNPGHYAWGDDGVLGLVVGGNSNGIFSSSIFTGRPSKTQIAPFPPNKFLIAIARAKTGHPSAAALLRPLAWWWCAANFSGEWLLNFGQIFGLPIRWATYDPNQPGLFEKVCDMLENMGSTAWAAMPVGTNLDLKEASKSGGGADTPQGSMLDRADRQCDLLILGETLTSDVGSQGKGSRALGEVHADVRDDVIMAAAEFAATVINNQFIPALLELNYGDTEEAPEFCPEPRKIEDAKANAERFQILAQTGLKIPAAFVYKNQEIPMPQPGEDVLEPQAAAQAQGPDGLAGQASSADGASVTLDSTLKARRAGDSVALPHSHVHDEVTDRLIESVSGVEARWLGGLRPFYRELVLMAQNASDDAEFELKLKQVIDRSAERFPELFAKMDVEFLADRIEGLLGASCVNGAVRGYLKRGSPSRRGDRRQQGDFVINASPGTDALARRNGEPAGGRR